jgi:5-bromo-4-chloroindolyl phosphate hydrolysis protein
MIDLFLLIVTIVNCILFVLILNWVKRIELYFDSTCTYLKSVRDNYKNIQDIYKLTEENYQIITEQYDEVAKLMGWRDKE